MNILKKISMDKSIVEMLQAYYEDYRAKQDLLTMIFELHKHDEDGSVVESAPFKSYEKQFMEAKIKYDTMMSTIQKTYIPKEYQKDIYRFEVNFDESVVEIKGR